MSFIVCCVRNRKTNELLAALPTRHKKQSVFWYFFFIIFSVVGIFTKKTIFKDTKIEFFKTNFRVKRYATLSVIDILFCLYLRLCVLFLILFGLN